MSVKKVLIKGFTYTAIAKYSGIVVSLIVTAILSRILSPTDFGVIAVATVVINFFNMISDMGVGPAIIQHRNIDKHDLRSIFTLTIYVGLSLTLLFYFLSSFISSFYDDVRLLNIFKIFSIAIFFHCIDIVPNSLLKKSKRFKFIATRSVLVQISTGILAVIAALCNMGIYSLLIQPVVSSIAIFVFNYMQYPLYPIIRLSNKSISKIISYSSYQFLFSVINYFSRNIDKLLSGKFFGISELGYYDKSYRLMMLPVGNLSHVITPAIQPIFADFQHDKKWLYIKSLKLIHILALIGLPLSAFLFFSSKECIILVFGNQWYESIPIFKILSLSVGIQIIYSPQGAFFQSANAVKEMFYCGIITAILIIIAVLMGCIVFNSIEFMAWGIVIAYFIAFIQVYYVMITRVLEQNFLDFFKIFYHPLILVLIISLLFIGVEYLISIQSLYISFGLKLLCYCIVMGIYEFKFKVFRSLLK